MKLIFVLAAASLLATSAASAGWKGGPPAKGGGWKGPVHVGGPGKVVVRQGGGWHGGKVRVGGPGPKHWHGPGISFHGHGVHVNVGKGGIHVKMP
jgi:hypothetical protein